MQLILLRVVGAVALYSTPVGFAAGVGNHDTGTALGSVFAGIVILSAITVAILNLEGDRDQQSTQESK